MPVTAKNVKFSTHYYNKVHHQQYLLNFLSLAHNVQLFYYYVLFRLQVDPSGEIIVLDTPCPWSDHLFTLEENDDNKSSIKYVLYKEQESDRWRVQAVPVQPDSFQSRYGNAIFVLLINQGVFTI